MPVSFGTNDNGPELGPGVTISWASDFSGPLEVGSFWRIHIYAGSEPGAGWIIATQPTQSPFGGRYTPWVQALNSTWNTTTNTSGIISNGTAAHAFVELHSPTGVLDSGTLDGTWDSVSGLPLEIANQGGGGGGFTQADRDKLTAAESRTTLLGEAGSLIVQSASGPLPFTLSQLFSRSSLDRLILEEMTSGPTCEPVRIRLAPIAQFAIVVRCTTIPEEIEFKTPDEEWAFPDLAVLRIFRGGDLLFRRGIHTPTFETDAPWVWGANFLDKNALGIPPPGTDVWVDWRVGVCGRVFIRHLP